MSAARNMIYEEWNIGMLPRMWRIREIKIYPVQTKIEREIGGEHSFYHLMLFRHRGCASKGKLHLWHCYRRRLTVPSPARPWQQPPFFWALMPLKQGIYLPSTSCSVGLGKEMAELKLIVNPLGNNEVMKKGLKLTKGTSSLLTRSGHHMEDLIPTFWSFGWACQDCIIICGHCPLFSLVDSCFNASHTFWSEFRSGTVPLFSDGTLQEMHFRHC